MGIFVMVGRCGADQVVPEGLELEEWKSRWFLGGDNP